MVDLSLEIGLNTLQIHGFPLYCRFLLKNTVI